MKVTQTNGISVYTVSGSSTSRSLPDWLARKRKRSLKNDIEYQNRIELIQDFEFEEASQCIRVSEDGEYAMATGTYKPQHHTYHLPSLALKYSRHHDSLNLTFLLLSTDYTKSLHLQTDRLLEFHTPMGCHYRTRIPRYGRGLGYSKNRAEALIPAEGREVFRLDLEQGRFLKPFEMEEDVTSGECVAIEKNCHGLLAFGTDRGTVEFWDHRSRDRVGVLTPPRGTGDNAINYDEDIEMTDSNLPKANPAITALEFQPSGLLLATGSAVGITTLYDIRSPYPLLIKDQQYGFSIRSLKFLHSSHESTPMNLHLSSFSSTSTPKVLSADKRIIKIWDQATGKPWTSIEPSVDINHVELVPNSGMIFTANEGRDMHSFFLPQLGPAPKWCSFLDNLTEEMAEAHLNDPDSYVSNNTTSKNAGIITTYDNYKFLTRAELAKLNLDHLIGTPKGNSVFRPYMHGYFVDQRLYEEARLIANPFELERERNNLIRAKIEKERESRIRSTKKDREVFAKVRVNKELAKRLVEAEEYKERKRSTRNKRVNEGEDGERENGEVQEKETKTPDVLKDSRFLKLFQEADFQIDENSMEYLQTHPGNVAEGGTNGEDPMLRSKPRRRTAVESEEESDLASDSNSSSADSNSDSEDPSPEAKERTTKEPQMRISSLSYRNKSAVSSGKRRKAVGEKSFAAKLATVVNKKGRNNTTIGKSIGVVGERSITFAPSSGGRSENRQKNMRDGDRRGADAKVDMSLGGGNRLGRRSASGNVFRRL